MHEKGREGGEGGENKRSHREEKLWSLELPCQETAMVPSGLLEAAVLTCILVTFMQPHNDGSGASALKH